MKLHVINGTPAPAPRRTRLKTAPADMVQCHRCGSREVIELRVGVVLSNGKPTGGTRSLCCASCHRLGERVVLA